MGLLGPRNPPELSLGAHEPQSRCTVGGHRDHPLADPSGILILLLWPGRLLCAGCTHPTSAVGQEKVPLQTSNTKEHRSPQPDIISGMGTALPSQAPAASAPFFQPPITISPTPPQHLVFTKPLLHNPAAHQLHPSNPKVAPQHLQSPY